MLILAGVTIATLTGNNGILTRVNQAKEVTEESEDIEKIRLAISEAQIGENGYQELNIYNLESALTKDGTKAIVSENEDSTKKILFLDKKKEYRLDNNGNIEDLNIDFNTKYVAPDSQDEARNKGVIGIGTDAEPIDMDLWEYTLMENGKYGLNDKNGLDSSGNLGRTAGYLGDFTKEGEIIGKIPQYISIDNGETYKEVVSLVHTFYNLEGLKIAPKIPNTVIDMSVCFYFCENLEKASEIPNSVINLLYAFARCEKLDTMPIIGKNVEDMTGTFQTCNSLININLLPKNLIHMSGTFAFCSKIENAPEIPKKVKEMNNTFQGCKSLKNAPEIIPNGVENMQSTFQDCESLENAPKIIPSSVNNLRFTFSNCYKLTGKIEINAIAKEYDNCFTQAGIQADNKPSLIGNCNVLEQLKEQLK